jgi:two-component system sensor histidine kinase TctE
VWFGVAIGLRPLLDLEDAISRRNSDDLSPIRRAVPVEARGLVTRLNTLFGQVDRAMEAQTTLISNAAHQLRNPIAGVLAMAEAVHSAPTDADARLRSDGLLTAARQTSELANKLLTLERVRAAGPDAFAANVDMSAVLREVADRFRADAIGRGVDLRTDIARLPVLVTADRLMVAEAISNLVDNALTHGGEGLGLVQISLTQSADEAIITVSDDGAGLARADVATVLSRFGQATPGEGSGLGLSIAEAVAVRHGGTLELVTERQGLAVILRLPLAKQA